MAKYVDGFVLVIPKDKADEYRMMAAMGRDSWMKNGALAYYECEGDDLATKGTGDQTTRAFTEMTGARDDQTVWFSFIIFKSKEHRDEVNARVMKEMDVLAAEYKDMVMPFDMKQMAYGGFRVVVEG